MKEYAELFEISYDCRQSNAGAIIESAIRNGRDYEMQMNYIHFNPIKYGYLCYIYSYYSYGSILVDEATISHLKNHLPEIVYDVEKGQDIQITRHGKPVAVIVSMDRYSEAFSAGKGIFTAYQRWRTLHPKADGFSDEEIKNMRDRLPHKASTSCWE